MQTDRSARQHPLNIWVSYAQWLAILTMTLEHTFRFVWPESTFTPWAQAMGRTAFPLFAAIVAWHLIHNSRKPCVYGLRVLLIGAISQAPYSFIVTSGKFNVCFTLAIGLLAVITVDRVSNPALKLVCATGLLLLANAAQPYVEYGLWGLLLVPAFAFGFRYRDHVVSLLPALAVCALINHAQLSMLISFLTGCAIFLASQSSLTKLPQLRLPRWLRLSWYPLHLSAVAVTISL